MRSMISANDEYVMIMDVDEGKITRIATDTFSTLAISRVIEEFSVVLGNRLRRGSGNEHSRTDRPDALGGRLGKA